jgi:signal transduction histidine kinase
MAWCLVQWRARSFWARVLVSLLMGTVILGFSSRQSFDLRLQIRGAQPASSAIVLITINESDWATAGSSLRSKVAPNILRSVKEIQASSDGFFWDQALWEKLLTKVLEGQPRSIGVTFFFGDNVRVNSMTASEQSVFFDPRVIWSAELDSAGRPLVPAFTATYNTNLGIKSVRSDDDGVVRRFSSQFAQIPHIAFRVSTSLTTSEMREQIPIVFAGPLSSFQSVRFTDLLSGRTSPATLQNKIVLIGSDSRSFDRVQTPLGPMGRLEVLANMANHSLANSTIGFAPQWGYLLLLVLILALGVRVLETYPQTVALVVFALGTMTLAALSTWAFDVARAWIPVLAPATMLGILYILFLSYQLNLKEQQTWRLEQEQRYNFEVEQLKSNFLGMMSHDLKTPIAKIQAICDRLVSRSSGLTEDHLQDLRVLRRSTDDLNRYIQSILQITRTEAKDFRLQMEVVDLNELIDRVLFRLRPLATERGLWLDTKLEPLFSIEVDSTLIQEVILNLVENALKYTPSGGRVLVKSMEIDNEVRFEVEDNGPGISAEDQAEVWGKFTRGKGANPTVKGTGLGLYLVKYFIELHSGRVFLESTPGQGTRIGFALPVA